MPVKHRSLSADDLVKASKSECRDIYALAYQTLPCGEVLIALPAEMQNLNDLASNLVMAGVPPDRIWPLKIGVGWIQGVRATAFTP